MDVYLSKVRSLSPPWLFPLGMVYLEPILSLCSLRTLRHFLFSWKPLLLLIFLKISAVSRMQNPLWDCIIRLRPHYASGIWKCIKSFLSTPCQRNVKMQQLPAILDLYLKKIGREITWLSWGHRFQNAWISQCFLSTWKWKAAFS